MNVIFKLILFSILLNFSVGIMSILLPDIGNDRQYSPNGYDSNLNSQFNQQMNETVNPTPDSSNTFFRLIDSLNIGLVAKMLRMVDNFMFGFVNFLNNLIPIPTAILIIFKSIISIAYVFGAFWLWTGKNLTQ